MRISTLLKTSVSVSISLVLVLGVANWLINDKLDRISITQERAQATERNISNLLVLTHEYAQYSEERASQQWMAIQSNIVANLEASAKDSVPAPEEALDAAKLLPGFFQ
jgi:hypothetical protein